MNDREKREKIIKYILKNRYRRIGQKEIADLIGYSVNGFNKFFSDYFELSFAKFMRKLNLRQAAKEIAGGNQSLDVIGKRNGFPSKSFYNAFHEEFGVKPAQFREAFMVPDMPCKTQINNRKIYLTYQKLENVVIEGYPMHAENGEHTDLLEECAYVFRHPSNKINLNDSRKQWGIWWHNREKKDQLHYLFGPPIRKEDSLLDGHVRMEIGGGNYAVFAIERGADYYEISRNCRELAWYVFNIWRDLNEKVMDTMGYTFEAFDQDYSYLYVPLVKGFGGIEVGTNLGNIINQVVEYVDEHAKEDLNPKQVAAKLGYSEFFIRDRFQSCFGFSLTKYIKKRKDDNSIAPPGNILNLDAFYKDHFRQINANTVELEDFTVLCATLKSEDNPVQMDLDIPSQTAYWMFHDLPSLEGTCYETMDGNRKMTAFYQTVKKETDKNEICRYVLGPLWKKEEPIPDGMEPIEVKGGKYIAFELSAEKIDEESLTEMIRTLLRCIDCVWIYDNWIRTDFQSHFSFLQFDGDKIYYFVPIYY